MPTHVASQIKEQKGKGDGHQQRQDDTHSTVWKGGQPGKNPKVSGEQQIWCKKQEGGEKQKSCPMSTKEQEGDRKYQGSEQKWGQVPLSENKPHQASEQHKWAQLPLSENKPHQASEQHKWAQLPLSENKPHQASEQHKWAQMPHGRGKLHQTSEQHKWVQMSHGRGKPYLVSEQQKLAPTPQSGDKPHQASEQQKWAQMPRGRGKPYLGSEQEKLALTPQSGDKPHQASEQQKWPQMPQARDKPHQVSEQKRWTQVVQGGDKLHQASEQQKLAQMPQSRDKQHQASEQQKWPQMPQARDKPHQASEQQKWPQMPQARDKPHQASEQQKWVHMPQATDKPNQASEPKKWTQVVQGGDKLHQASEQQKLAQMPQSRDKQHQASEQQNWPQMPQARDKPHQASEQNKWVHMPQGGQEQQGSKVQVAKGQTTASRQVNQEIRKELEWGELEQRGQQRDCIDRQMKNVQISEQQHIDKNLKTKPEVEQQHKFEQPNGQHQGDQQHRLQHVEQKQPQNSMYSKQQQSNQSAIPKIVSPHMRTASTSSSSSMQSVNSHIIRGTTGRPGRVAVNYLDIQMDKMPAIAYHYDVTLTPDLPKKFLRPAFEQFNRQYFPEIHMAYDGKSSFYTVKRLPTKAITHEVEIDDSGTRRKKFKICVKETLDAEIDLNSLRRYSHDRVFDKPMRALQCIEVVLANPCHSKAVRAGRSYFKRPKEKYDLKDGYEMWIGLYQSAILGDNPFLNVDISHKSFPTECNILDYIKWNIPSISPNQPISPRDLYALKDYLRGIDIIYEPPAQFGSTPKRYKVMDISREPAASLKVSLDNNVVVTVADYFKSKGYTLRNPKWSCLKVGSSVKSIHLPIELCSVPSGQTINKKDGPRQVQHMIKYAATSTDVRKQKIMSMLNYFQHNLDAKVKGFGIQIGTEFKMVPMRVLKSPQLEYYSCDMITPMKGAWRMKDSTKFLHTKQINIGHQWGVIYSRTSRISYSVLQQFFGKVADVARKLNVCLAPKPPIVQFDNISVILRDFKNKKFDLVFVVITPHSTSYAEIKQEAELKVGLLTQCILENTIVKRGDYQTISNILLKINGKLNGTNHRVNPKTNIPLQKVMFLGADVTHPSPDQKHIPSVVGVAASHDNNGARYNMQYRLQKSTCEEIVDMDSIFAHHLKVYQQYQGAFPDHIIYYRDGVSDGQFPRVRDIELRSIRAACKKAGISPKLTCIIAIKRHHTRFFPETPNRSDKFNNVDPGTIVDRVIVHPNEVQFFLVSHQSIQGTAKPTRYNVLVDDANMDINDLQTLTYNLCHMFPRCNRVVSYPAPAYLAHLVAYRGRVYIEGETRFADPKKEYERRLVNKEFMNSNPMYFI